MKKLTKLDFSNNKTYLVSLSIIFFILLNLGVFAYYYYYKKIDNEEDDLDLLLRDKKNFSISFALAGANKTGVIITSIITIFLIIYLHYLRNNKLILFAGSLLSSIILGIIISLLYITPIYDAHADLAAVGFGATFLYNLLVTTILYLNYKNLALFLGFLIPNIIIAITLILIVTVPSISEYIYKHEKDYTKYETLFASAELIIVFLFVCSILLLGFFKKKLKAKRI